MKLIIAGTRTFNEYDILEMMHGTLEFFNIKSKDIKEIVCGTCDGGGDKAGELFQEINEHIVLEEFKPDWPKFGKKAGMMRNAEMAEYGDILLLFWNGESPGSKNMKKEMLTRGKPVYEVILRSHNERSRP